MLLIILLSVKIFFKDFTLETIFVLIDTLSADYEFDVLIVC
jgi:hypothetical protein